MRAGRRNQVEDPPSVETRILIACTYDSRLQNRRPRCSLTYFLRRRTVRRGSWEHGAASCLNMTTPGVAVIVHSKVTLLSQQESGKETHSDYFQREIQLKLAKRSTCGFRIVHNAHTSLGVGEILASVNNEQYLESVAVIVQS